MFLSFVYIFVEKLYEHMEYKYDEESVNALMKWAENAQLPKELQLSEAENIMNLRQYVVANINDIKAHYIYLRLTEHTQQLLCCFQFRTNRIPFYLLKNRSRYLAFIHHFHDIGFLPFT